MQKSRRPRRNSLELARVLLVDDNPTSRLTLQTVLKAGGYSVDSAASAAEAIGKLDQREYELVLSDFDMESPDAGWQVLAHARMMEYKPATAFIHAESEEPEKRSGGHVLVEPEGLPDLLGKVALLISERATRRISRELRSAGASI